MPKTEILDRIKKEKVLALIRADGPESLTECAAALSKGGLNAIELTMTTPGALKLVAEVSRKMPGILLGLGTVLDAETARAGIAAGAQFIVTPGVRPEVIGACNGLEVPNSRAPSRPPRSRWPRSSGRTSSRSSPPSSSAPPI